MIVTVHCTLCKIVGAFEGERAEAQANALAEFHQRDQHKTWTKQVR